MEPSDILSKESSLSNQNKRSERQRKQKVVEDPGWVDPEKAKNAKNPLLAEVFKKCERGLQRIKKHQFSEFFMNSNNPEIPSLNQIEKNLKNYQYNNIFQFGLDLRKLWNFYFSNYANNPDVFQKTCKLSEFSEEVLKELESQTEDKTDIQALHQRVDKIYKEIKEFQGKSTTPSGHPPPKKADKNVSIMDKAMTMQEKNILGNNIRNLSPDQLKGIVNILSDSLFIDQQSKFFEFDIETLSTRKLRELERYVKSCFKAKPPQTKPEPKKKPHNMENLSEKDKIDQLKVFCFIIILA
jgi:hypothetical protein